MYYVFMTTDSVIGQNIQEARYRAGMSQADLAELLSVHRSALSRMEAGLRAVTAVELVRIAAFLGVSEADLLAPRSRVRASPRTSRLLLRAAYVTEDDHEQLNWASDLWMSPANIFRQADLWDPSVAHASCPQFKLLSCMPV